MQEFREAIEAKHVNYVFDRRRVQAHALAAEAERLLARKKAAAASTRITQALYAAPDCVSALIAAGRYNFFVNRIPKAKEYFSQAHSINPRANIQKELGWISLEDENYSQAISLLIDHLQRNAADYEAYPTGATPRVNPAAFNAHCVGRAVGTGRDSFRWSQTPRQ